MKALKALRMKKGVRQNEIADYLRVGRTTYSKWETGVAEPNISALIKLADYFNVSVDKIIGHEVSSGTDKPKALKIVNNSVIYRYKNKTIKQNLTEDEMRIVVAMLNAISENRD